MDSLMEKVATAHDNVTVIKDLLWLKIQAEERCLFETALWADECLLNQPDERFSNLLESDFQAPFGEDSIKTKVAVNFVRSLIRGNEYHRACFFAEKFPKPLSPLHCFLYHFAGYLACIRRKSEADPETAKKSDPIVGKLCIKTVLLKEENPEMFDCWMLYLLGMMWKLNSEPEKAKDAFCEAVRKDYRCWPAWENLAIIIEDKAEIVTIVDLPVSSWYYKMFAGKVYQRLNLLRNAVDVYEDLANNLIGAVPYVIVENAAATAALQEHVSSSEMFEALRKADPYRIDSMEVYADSLYIRFQVEQLYILARFYEKSHKFSWQTCAIMGNYFSMTGQHTRAHKILITATNLSPKNSLLWVLLGHECMELKNPTDAVSSYYKALEIDSMQYRAYYGLGQVYEIFKYVDFALYFYEQAHRCRPTDSRMLVAMGVNFFHLHRYKDAENAFLKAFKVGDVQGNALMKLGNLYEETNELEKACKAYNAFLTVYGDESHADQLMVAHACLFLAKYNLEKHNLDEANNFAQRCLGDEITKEEALHVIREVQMQQLKGAPVAGPSRYLENSMVTSRTNADRSVSFKTPQHKTTGITTRSTARRQRQSTTDDEGTMETSEDEVDISFG